ncbi:MAG TPA: SDR family NAD(P)-dependent oxidoreductase [Sphingobacterium sp.]|nr:SDR family NAD(P)-dependent oxidoreductase [Sphingobacterium sp.]
MNEKIVLVSGAAGNLGSAVVEYFLEEGCRVIGLVHRATGRARAEEKYSEFALDLLDEKAIQNCINGIIKKQGQINIAVLTVGGFTLGTLEKTSMQDLNHLIRLNFETAYNLARPVLAEMKKYKSGKLFFIGSLKGLDTSTGKGTVAYSLSKSLLLQLTNIINADTKGSAVSAYYVAPSTIDTPQNREAMPEADFSNWEKPSQIAEIIGRYAKVTKENRKIVIQDEMQ